MRSHWSPWVSLSGGERWAGGRQSGLRVDLDQPAPGRPVPKCVGPRAASPGWTGLALRAPCWRLREQQAHNESLPIHGGCQRPGVLLREGSPSGHLCPPCPWLGPQWSLPPLQIPGNCPTTPTCSHTQTDMCTCSSDTLMFAREVTATHEFTYVQGHIKTPMAPFSVRKEIKVIFYNCVAM